MPRRSRLASPADVDFDFDMKVARVAEHPRITKPFSDESWQALDKLGRSRSTPRLRRAMSA
jgi:uncharacterized protein (DUF2126 family)